MERRPINTFVSGLVKDEEVMGRELGRRNERGRREGGRERKEDGAPFLHGDS